MRCKDESRYPARVNPIVMVGLTAAVVAMLAHGLGDFNLHIPANALQVAMIMGLAMTAQGEARRTEGP